MAVARIHGKVKCRPFKEKRRRAHLQSMASLEMASLFHVFFFFFTEF